MRIAIFSENLLGILNSSGGAEVYTLVLAECLMKMHSVVVFTLGNNRTELPKDVLRKYNITPKLEIRQIHFEHSKKLLFDIPKRIVLWFKMRRVIINDFDVFVNTTHNRMLGFKKITSIHLIHFPVKNYSAVLPKVFGSIMNRLYRNSYKLFIANSVFTQYYIKREWLCNSIVLNPPINMQPVMYDSLKEKEAILLMVGRIVVDKRIREIVDFFESIKNLPQLSDYKLVIAGNKDPTEIDFYEYLKDKQYNSKIRIYSDLDYKSLVDIYKRSRFFIHAKGYLESEENPMQMEHFGMTTVEAMANGCIPLVINKAGQKEIVDQGVSGYLWNDLFELRDFLLNIIDDDVKMKKLQKGAIEKSKLYLIDSFSQKVMTIFNSL